MIVTSGAFAGAYDAICETYTRGGHATVPIFAACTVDALCGLSILRTLLQKDGIQYQVVPVSSWVELEAAYAENRPAESDLGRACVFLDCGATEDLVERLGGVAEADTIYVVDSHRPIHLNNASASNDAVVCLQDDPDGVGGAMPLSEDDSTDDEGDEGEEGGVGGEGGLGARARPERRGAGAESPRSRQRRKRQRTARLQQARERYYRRGSFAGRSCGYLLYGLLGTQHIEVSNEQLWMAIVALTDQYVHERIGQEEYNVQMGFLADEVSRVNFALDGGGGGHQTGERSALEPAGPSNSHNLISCKDEFKFMLLNHWSLYESMYHSVYMASRLEIWNEKGKRRLDRMLAKIGIPRLRANQKYAHLSDEYCSKLIHGIQEYAEAFGIGDVYFPSFHRVLGCKTRVSASDMVFSISAMLENWQEHGVQTASDNFCEARRALSSPSAVDFHRGLNLSQELQKSVVRQAISVLARREIIRVGGGMRRVRLDHSPELSMMNHPLALAKLAQYLYQAKLYEQGAQSKNRELPLVLAALQPAMRTYIVVGTSGRQESGTAPVRNKFGEHFAQVAAELNLAVKQDFFDTAVIELPQEAYERFMLHLGELLDSSA